MGIPSDVSFIMNLIMERMNVRDWRGLLAHLVDDCGIPEEEAKRDIVVSYNACAEAQGTDLVECFEDLG